MTTAPKRQPIPFGKYLLLDRVNIGGMAEVWRAKTFGAGGFERIVAIKRILPNIAEDEEFISMFIDEAKITDGEMGCEQAVSVRAGVVSCCIPTSKNSAKRASCGGTRKSGPSTERARSASDSFTK